jgi:VIT1/CCC1 family predicted Fe2+/Mn2+ transporter
MAATNSDIIMNIVIVIFGLIIIGARLLMLVVSRKLIRCEISRQRYMGIGIRIKEAFASDEAWYRINRGGGKLMIIPSLAYVVIGALIALCPFILHGYRETIVIAGLVGVVAVMFLLFGYVIWVQRNEPGRKTV